MKIRKYLKSLAEIPTAGGWAIHLPEQIQVTMLITRNERAIV